MARKVESIAVSVIHERHAGCAECGTDGPFEQTYALPNC
jgi:hypothetical protein